MNHLKEMLCKSPTVRKYLSDNWHRVFLSLSSSFTWNLLYAAWEIVCGIYYQSYWFVTFGCYYILLMMARLVLLSNMYRKDETREMLWKKYRTCGILLFLINFILSGIVVLAVNDENGSRYAGYLIYAVATYTFYRIVKAIRNLIKYRRTYNPVLTASNTINFVSALISVLSLEIAMILQFGNDKDFFRIMTISTGFGVYIVISVTAIHMIIKANKNI